MAGIFLNYRREDSSGYAGRLADDLSEQFPGVRIFRDVESIQPGVEFTHAIQHALGSCAVCLVLIGPRWLTAVNASGRSRLYDADDFVRLEIASALARGIVVIPILVGATMPRADQLPDDLKALTRRQAYDLSERRWDYDLRLLAETLARPLGIPRGVAWLPPQQQLRPKTQSGSWLLWMLMGFAGLALIASLTLLFGAALLGESKKKDCENRCRGMTNACSMQLCQGMICDRCTMELQMCNGTCTSSPRWPD
jgi:hypothetical protein